MTNVFGVSGPNNISNVNNQNPDEINQLNIQSSINSNGNQSSADDMYNRYKNTLQIHIFSSSYVSEKLMLGYRDRSWKYILKADLIGETIPLISNITNNENLQKFLLEDPERKL